GDTGAQGCGTAQICVGYPSGDPSVVSVGGTNTPRDTSGRLSGVLTGWTGSGGGCSTIFAQPAFQAGVTPFGTSCSRRMQPDVALDADTSTGVAVDYDASPGLGGRQVVAVGGTSVSSPQMAAMWALVLQACKQTAGCATGGGPFPYRLGNPNPLLYAIYGGKKPLSYAQVFYDVGFGNNAQTGGTGYTAGPGYDLVTGIGAPFGRNLIKAVVGV
ncbi:MAG: S8 family serine peptidase, partial [Candidatus Eremiobacteraeota bacterium]|nr:S8 family serine peptidase [Candidatus Eremiobacteraeota bacterium]